jgi:hypothetical protein
VGLLNLSERDYQPRFKMLLTSFREESIKSGKIRVVLLPLVLEFKASETDKIESTLSESDQDNQGKKDKYSNSKRPCLSKLNSRDLKEVRLVPGMQIINESLCLITLNN